jgi:hypothetical protein
VRRLGSNQLVLWISFVLVHLWLGMLNLFGPGLPLGDVTYTYKFWVEQSILNGYTVGIDGGFVYPIVALVPMYLSWIFGPEVYSSTWLSMIMLLNATAFGMLTGWGFRHERLAAAWWWIAFLVLLGPISLGRIDSVTIPLAIIGVTLLAKRPAIAALLLAVATWIKVWPAALLAAIVVATRHRLTAIWMSAAVSVTVIGIALLYGSGGNVFSFFTQQAGRGMQVEAPASTVWLWLAKAGVPDTFVYYDQGILTYQIQGVGTDVASQIMTPLMACVALVVVVAGVFAVWRGASAAHVLPPLALALVTTLIALNKVGSPQFVSWFAVPIVLGLVTSAVGGGIRFRVPAILVLTIGGLTQVIYPYLYPYLLGLDTVMLLAITLRNLLYFVLLAWAIHAIVSLEAVAVEDDEVPDADDSVWPFGALRRAKL